MGRRRPKIVSGVHLKGKARHVYVCERCRTWHDNGKPVQCRDCGNLTFIHFPAKSEAKRFAELCLEEKLGDVTDIELQPTFILSASNGAKVGTWRADFRYKRGDETVVEDVKGNVEDALRAWKRKHVEIQEGIKIEIVRR